MVTPIPEDIRVFGPLQPMRFEATVDDVIVAEGKIPEDLNGGFYRVGPSWKRPTVQGTVGFAATDAMVQGLVFREGRADFRNRWVRTPKYLLEEKLGRAVFEWADGGFGDWRDYGLANSIPNEFTEGVPSGSPVVNVFPFGGQVLASGEQCLPPIALDPISLDTVGIVPWSSKLARGMSEPACFGDSAFTAHPKWDEATGMMYGWSYKDTPPYITLHWVTTDGRVRSREIHEVPYAQNAHDCWLTEKYVVLAVQPFTMGLDRVTKGLAVFGWEPEKPTVLVLVPRDDINGEVRTITCDFETQYIMHTMSANHAGDKLILDGPIFDRPPFPFEDEVEFGVDFVPFGSGVNGRWTVDLTTGKVTSEIIGDRAVEFPKVDERFYGKNYEWGFLAEGESLWSLDTITRRNVLTGKEESYTIKTDEVSVLFEPTFAPRSPDAPEGDGYLLVPISRFTENLSEYQIFDTQGLSDGPICRIELPFQIGWTPHGHWMDFR
jgi:carotenoid cleavage dioxygenase